MSIPCLLAFVLFPFGGDAPPQGFKAVFDGKDLAGFRGRAELDPAVEAKWSAEERAAKQREWDADVAKHWRVENGEIVNDGSGVYLTSAADYRDFELMLDWKMPPKGDSGIYLKATPQVQIWDPTEEAKRELGADKGSGSLWNNERFARFPTEVADKPLGEWNAFRILQVGARTTVDLNGRRVVDLVPQENYWDRALPLPASGPFQLQTHGGEMRFRGVYAREIGAEEANRILASRDAQGFQPIFDGKTLDGWQGATADYEVVDGAIRCRAGQGGNLFTRKEYGDFTLRLEIRLPPGGNNGLAIRYPGEGDAAYDGMCELQVLDDPADMYRDIQPWQCHGSAYGQVAAHRGYLRPTGQWNFEEVRVRGSKIEVELNGTIILDTDLATAGTPPSGHEHRGRTRTKGFLGFCGHGDPVEFRRVEVRER